MFDLRAAGLPKLNFDTASLVMGYRHAAGELSLAQGEVVLADGRTISLSADLRDLRRMCRRWRFGFVAISGRSTRYMPTGRQILRAGA